MKNRILKIEKLNADYLTEFQPETLKYIKKTVMEKLKKSIIENGFASPFLIWKHDGINHILDGHFRLRVFRDMLAAGEIENQKLPCAILDVADETEAKKLLLIFNSRYAEFDDLELGEFIGDIDISQMNIDFEFKMESSPIPENVNIENLTPEKNESGIITCPKCGAEIIF